MRACVRVCVCVCACARGHVNQVHTALPRCAVTLQTETSAAAQRSLVISSTVAVLAASPRVYPVCAHVRARLFTERTGVDLRRAQIRERPSNFGDRNRDGDSHGHGHGHGYGDNNNRDSGHRAPPPHTSSPHQSGGGGGGGGSNIPLGDIDPCKVG